MTILLVGINKIDIEKKNYFLYFILFLKSDIYEHLNDKQDTSTHQRKMLRYPLALELHPSPRVWRAKRQYIGLTGHPMLAFLPKTINRSVKYLKIVILLYAEDYLLCAATDEFIILMWKLNNSKTYKNVKDSNGIVSLTS